MTLYESWISKAYDKKGQSIKSVWDLYMPLEQVIYEKMLKENNPHIKGTVEELATSYKMNNEHICGFLDGIKDGLDEDKSAEYDVEKLETTTEIDITVNFERLYKKMVEYNAEHLYSLPEWINIFPEEMRKQYYIDQKQSSTYVRESEKIGRNDQCPCGSGKKYKKCHGNNINNLVNTEKNED